ncbi:hypothetical protein [Acidocella sp.]|uniref:hypothetical protein n=1 Tax=Acidocella sp. TaxID=50710 RepID=UPI00261C78D0|nr:hypothetical protein [Acidocella sp.]
MKRLLPLVLLSACATPPPAPPQLHVALGVGARGHFLLTFTAPDGTPALLGGSTATWSPIPKGPAQFTYSSPACTAKLGFTAQMGETIFLTAGELPTPRGHGWSCYARGQAVQPNGTVIPLP